jgi:hypothetical protein
VSFKDANKVNAHIPDQMMGALSKREAEMFVSSARLDKMVEVKDTGGYDSLEEGDVKWQHKIDLEKERSAALNVLASVVPANEVFLTSKKQSNKAGGGNNQTSEVDRLTRKGD